MCVVDVDTKGSCAMHLIIALGLAISANKQDKHGPRSCKVRRIVNTSYEPAERCTLHLRMSIAYPDHSWTNLSPKIISRTMTWTICPSIPSTKSSTMRYDSTRHNVR